MNPNSVLSILVLFSISSTAFCASFPHKTVSYKSTMKGPMVSVETDSYVVFSDDPNESITAEWTKQASPAGNKRTFNLTQQGKVYALDLDTQHCTKTDLQPMMDQIGDPEKFAQQMKQQMGLKKSGACAGAGLPGTKYTSSFGEMCFYQDVFLLWQKVMGSTTTISDVVFDETLPQEKIELPSGVTCVDGPDLSKGLDGLREYSNSSAAKSKPKTQNPQSMEEAMKKAQEAMEQLKGMYPPQ